MKITQWIIGLAFFSGIVIGLSLFSQSLFATYSINGTANLTSLSRAQQINEAVNETATNIQSQTGFLQSVFTSVALLWAVLTQLITLPFLFIGLSTDIAGIFAPYGGIPGWFMVMIGTVITVLIVYKVAEIISGRQGEL